MSISLEKLDGAKYFPSEDKKVGIILFHAYTGSPVDVNLLARLLNRTGYGVLSPLFKGHRTKDVNDILSEDLSVWKEQAQFALDEMQAEYDQVLTFGLSMGGIFATWLMTKEDTKITAGGVFNSPVVTAENVNVEKPFEAYTRFLFKNNSNLGDFDQEFPGILAKHREQMSELDEFKQGFEQELANITTPFYIAQSLQDEMIEETDAKLLRNQLENATISYNEFPENTHVITTNRNRGEFEESLLTFIKQSIQ